MEVSRGSKSDESCQRSHWRLAEDEKLRKLVVQHGPKNWNFIAEHFDGRSGKSCRLRWYNQLDPNINKRPFNMEEEERLLKAHAIHGNRWASIAKTLPGRTDNAVKNQFHVIMARRKREGDTLPSLNNLNFGHWSYRPTHTQDSFPYYTPDLGSSSVSNDLHEGDYGNTSLVGFDKSYTFNQMSDKSSFEDGLISNLADGGGENENDNENENENDNENDTFIDFLGVELDSH